MESMLCAFSTARATSRQIFEPSDPANGGKPDPNLELEEARQAFRHVT